MSCVTCSAKVLYRHPRIAETCKPHDLWHCVYPDCQLSSGTQQLCAGTFTVYGSGLHSKVLTHHRWLWAAKLKLATRNIHSY